MNRFLACVAYLDGVRPSVIMCRGYYGRSVLAAWDWRDGKLTSRWVFDSATHPNKGQPYECGVVPRHDARAPFSVHYYLVAVLFVLFDLKMEGWEPA